MITIICDKCRKEFNKENEIIRIRIEKSGIVGIDMDFCENCYKKIEDVIGKDKIEINLEKNFKKQ